jgi:hypothetical protein
MTCPLGNENNLFRILKKERKKEKRLHLNCSLRVVEETVTWTGVPRIFPAT